MDDIKGVTFKSFKPSIEIARKNPEGMQLNLNNEINETRKSQFDKAQRDKALSGFESMLIHEVFKSMWSSVEKSDLFGDDSNESQIYRDMMIEAVSDETAKGRGVGVKAYLQSEMDRFEQSKNPKKVG